jgi:hypothetical protein
MLCELVVDVGLALGGVVLAGWLLARLAVALMGYGDSE